MITINKSKIIFISDIHFGLRSSSEEWQNNIKNYFYHWFIPKIKELKNKKDICIVCLGDVFDDRKAINIEVNNLAIDIFTDLGKIYPIYIINGNHDLYKRNNLGSTSLRSLENIHNVNIITKSEILNFKNENIDIKIIAIPYLGDTNEETKILNKNSLCQYAFMHTDIINMKYDNNQLIIAGVNTSKFNGKIFSGHIHKRQEMKNIIYIGSPYQMRRSDINNEKGIYILNLKTSKLAFIKNNYSPIFQKIDIEDFNKLSEEEQFNLIDNNYNDILIKESELQKYKLSDIYEIANKSNAKRLSISIIKNLNNTFEEDINIKEVSLEDIINYSIDNIEREDIDKNNLKLLSQSYLHSAQEQLNENSIN